MSPVAKHLLAPGPTTLLFGLKGVIAVAMALSIAFYLQLERPFWAVVAAMMLQGRPQFGLVIEKSLLLVAATVCGGIIAFFILESFVHHPSMIVAALASVAFACTYFGSAHRHVNYSYGFALIPVTAAIVTLLAGTDAAHISSRSIFDIFISRLSEVSVGALSASLCSALIMPSKISDILGNHVKTLTIDTLETLALAFDRTASSRQVQAKKRPLLLSITQILDESRSAALEGDSRKTDLVAHECLKLAILTQSILRIRHRSEPAQNAIFELLATQLYGAVHKMRDGLKSNVPPREFLNLALSATDPGLHHSLPDSDLAKILDRIRFHISYLLSADKNVLLPPEKPKPSFTHDPLGNSVIGLRVAAYVVASSTLWMLSGGTSSQVMMIIIPLLFSQLFANAPNLSLVVIKLLAGSLIALPIGVFWALYLLSWGSGNIQILYLIFLSPLFFALMAMTHPASAPYAVAFCFTYVLMVQPDNKMTFDFYNSLSLGLGVITGLCILYACITLIPKPNSKHIQYNSFRFLGKEARKFALNKTSSNSFESKAQGAILNIAKHSTQGGQGRLTLARAMEIHGQLLGSDESPRSAFSVKKDD